MSYPSTSFPAAPNAADWSEYIEVLDDDTGTAFDLSTSIVEMEVTDQRNCRMLYGSTADGTISLVADGFEFLFPASSMKRLCAGSYTVNVRLTDSITGAIAEPIIANLPIIEGGYR